MNAPTQYPPPPTDPRVVRELTGAVLLILGLLGLVVCAFVWHPLAGFAALSVLSSAVGLLLANSRE